MITDKILHVCIDEKFNRIIVDQFNSVDKAKNDYLIVSEDSVLQYPINSTNAINVFVRNYDDSKLFIKKYKFLIFHSLKKENLYLAARLKPEQYAAWFSWGGDIKLSQKEIDNYLEPITRNIKGVNKDQKKVKKRYILGKYVPSLVAKYHFFRTKEYLKNEAFSRAYKKFKFVSTVLPEEFDLVRKATGRNDLIHLNFTYGDIHILTKDVKISVLGSKVLIGHSGFLENNQLDLFPLLSDYSSKEEFDLLLNYGDSTDIRIIKEQAKEVFGDNISFVENYMSAEDYINFLGNYKVLFLNTIQQQGLGIMYLALFYGLKVFLNPKGILYRHCVENGLIVSKIYEKDNLDFSQLNTQQQSHNKKTVSKILSQEKILKETRHVQNTLLKN